MCGDLGGVGVDNIMTKDDKGGRGEGRWPENDHFAVTSFFNGSEAFTEHRLYTKPVTYETGHIRNRFNRLHTKQTLL